MLTGGGEFGGPDVLLPTIHAVAIRRIAIAMAAENDCKSNSYTGGMEEAEFRVGDIVRLRSSRAIHTARGPWPQYQLEMPLRIIPSGTEGVIKRQQPSVYDGCDWSRFGTYMVAFPEMHCFEFVHRNHLDFIEHLPSPAEIAAMYAEVR